MFYLILLAVIQGLAEFLPISSSAHLVIAQHFLNMPHLGIDIEIMLHFATLGSLIIFFLGEILILLRICLSRISKQAYSIPESSPIESHWPKLIVVSCFVTGVVGYLGRAAFEWPFQYPSWVCGILFVMGAILLWSKKDDPKGRSMTMRDAIVFGLAQSLALLPGISRSGLTIIALMFLGHSSKRAFTYSFLSVIPLLLVIGCVESLRGLNTSYDILSINIAMITCLLVGLGALHLLKRLIKHHHFHYFGYYCMGVGLLSLGAIQLLD